MQPDSLATKREALLDVSERLRASTTDHGTHLSFEEASATGTQPLEVPEQGRAQLRVVTFNLLCTALGVGVLAIPHVFASVGMLGGLLLLVVIPMLADRSAAFTTEGADTTGVVLLNRIMTAAFGMAAGRGTELVLALYSLSALLGQLVVLKQLLPPILLFLGVNAPTLPLLGALSTFVLVPLSSLPTMERLKITSLASVALQVVIVITIVLAGVRAWSMDCATAAASAPSPQGAGPAPMPWLVLEPLAWMRGTPVVAFAYQFHQNVPFLLRELRHKQDPLGRTTDSKWESKGAKMQTAIRVALATCCVLYAAVALASGAAFGVDVEKNLLVSLSSARGLSLLPPWLVAAVQGAMSLVMVCVFPVNSFGLRVSLHSQLYPGQPEAPAHRWMGAAFLTAVSFAIASVVDDLGVLFAIIGATMGTLIMFVMPGALALRLRSRRGGSEASYEPLQMPGAPAVGAGSPVVVLDTPLGRSPRAAACWRSRGNLLTPSVTLAFGVAVGVCGIAAVCM